MMSDKIRIIHKFLGKFYCSRKILYESRIGSVRCDSGFFHAAEFAVYIIFVQ